jgi:hypothetical protein
MHIIIEKPVKPDSCNANVAMNSCKLRLPVSTQAELCMARTD